MFTICYSITGTFWVWLSVEENSFTKTIHLRIRFWNVSIITEIFVFFTKCACVWVWGFVCAGMAQKQSETAFREHCEPRESCSGLWGVPQMYVVLEVIRAVTWHSNVPACSADVGQLTSVSHCSSTRTSLAAIFILITTPIITRDYSNISERTHPHTVQPTVMLWLRYSAPYGFLGGFWGRICMFLAFQWKALKKPA